MDLTCEEIKEKTIRLIHNFIPELQDAELDESSIINTDTNIDSLSLIMLITKVESTFNIRIPRRERTSINTLGELLDKTAAAVSLFPLEEFEHRAGNFELVVNATPVGMSPFDDATPFPTTMLHAGQCVLDIVYNPRRTRLLNEAQRRGCKTVEGIGMLLNQGAKSFELWTGREAPIDVMKRALGLD